MEKTPRYTEGGTRDPRNPPDEELDAETTEDAKRAIERADKAREGGDAGKRKG